MGVKEAMETVGRALSGGAAGAAAKVLSPDAVHRRIDPEAVPPEKAASEPASKMVDPKTGIRFAKGGMVRRGYGKARGA